MATPLAGTLVLVVEDEFLILMDVMALLERAGAEVVVADSVASGISVAKSGKPYTVALLDVRLPDGEVFPVAEALSEQQVPIVFYSGHAQPDELTERFGDAVVLTKPVPGPLLVETVARQAAARA